MKANIVHQGRGGYIEIDDLKFDIEMMASGPNFCIYVPRRELDKKIKKAIDILKNLEKENPEMWELYFYDANHGFYNAMTVNERLYVSGLIDNFDKARETNDKEMIVKILQEVEVPESDIEKIANNA